MEVDTVNEFENFLSMAVRIDLPLGIYSTNLEGIILSHNKYLGEIFRNQNIVDGKTNVADFYQDSRDRDKTIEWFMNPENRGKWSTNVLLLKNVDDEIIVKDACCAILSTDGSINKFFGFLIDIRDEYRYGRLFEDLPIGVYQLDSEDRFVKVNDVVWKMLGYGRDELVGTEVNHLYAKQGELNDVTDSIKKPPYYVENQKVELVRKDGEKIWVSLNSFKIPKSGDKYFGREGTVIDITNEELRNKLLFNVPVGFYIVRSDQDKHVVEHCNDQFAKIFGYTDANGVINKNPEVFFASKEDYRRYLDAIDEAERRKEGRQPLWGYTFKGKKANGELFTSEINSQYTRGIDNRITGRVGVVRDISKENVLRERIDEITSDIGAVLHTYSTVLIQNRLYIEAVSQCLGEDPFDLKKQLDYQQIIVNVEQHRTILAEAIDHHILHLTQKAGLSPISNRHLQNLIEINTKLKDFKTEKIEKLKVPDIRMAAYDVQEELKKSKIPGIARQEIKQLRDKINDVLRVSGFVALHEMNDTIVEIERQVRSFREYVTEDIRVKPDPSAEDVVLLIRDAAFDFKEFAHSRNTEIRTILPSEVLKVLVIKNEFFRAMSNLFHNAIKYSWSRKPDGIWIQVDVKREGNRVIISFENYGVPIHKDELERGFIYRMGYRGVYSGDRGRIGTGFGLNDTYNTIVKKYGGNLDVVSKPADPYGDPTNYNQPFLTKVTIYLNLLGD